MNNKFDGFPEISDSDAESKVESKNQSENLTVRSDDIKKLIEQMKKQRKAQRKMKKKICKISKQLSLDDESSEFKKGGGKDSQKENSTNASPKKEKSFWVKMGDAMLKALPGIFRTAATVMAAIILGQTPKPLGKFGKAVA